ncbi:hypothetical protein N5P37_011461 [Trichoderma harzianum]|nr:hypothetical protein N5P37_011461 [Trichoderma harzianum]
MPGSMKYPLPISYEPWNSLLGLMEDSSQPTTSHGAMNMDLQSDTASPTMYSLGSNQNTQFTASLFESPTISNPSLCISGAGKIHPPKPSTSEQQSAFKIIQRKRRQRHSYIETEKKERIQRRNRVAASKCRQKKRNKMDSLKEQKASLEARNNDLHQEYQRGRTEIDQIKNNLILHTECKDINIDHWVRMKP